MSILSFDNECLLYINLMSTLLPQLFYAQDLYTVISHVSVTVVILLHTLTLLLIIL